MQDIKDEQIAKIVHDIEQGAQDFQFTGQIADTLGPAIERAREIEDKDAERKLVWEFELFRLVAAKQTAKDDPRFKPVMTGTNAKGEPVEFPDIKTLVPVALDYFTERYEQTANPLLKATYADFLWVYAKKRDPAYAKAFIEATNGLLDEYYEKTWFFRIDNAFNRMLYFAARKVVDAKALAAIKKDMFGYLDRMLADGKHRFCAELIEHLSALPNKQLTEAELDRMTEITEQCAEAFKDTGDWHLRNHFLELRSVIASKRGEEVGIKEARRRQAETLEQTAQDAVGKGENIRASTFFQDALHIYQDIGETSKVRELEKKIVTANKNAEPEFQEFSQEITIKNADIDKLLEPVMSAPNAEEALKRLSAYFSMFPQYGSVKDLTDKVLRENPLQALIRRTIQGADGQLIKADVDPFEATFAQNYQIELNIGASILARLFGRLTDEKKLTSKELQTHFKNWPLVKPNNLHFLNHGIDRFMDGDHISAVHIFAPQAEAAVRNLVAAAGLNVSSYIRQQQGTRYASLTELLKRPEAEQILGIDVLTFTRMVLVDPLCLNLRNEVGHGLIPPEKCTPESARILLHLLIVLTAFKPVEPEKPVKKSKTPVS